MKHGINLLKVSTSFLQLNADKLGALGLTLPPKPAEQNRLDLSQLRATKADVKAEKELQRLCQNGLNQRGYVSLTGENAARCASTNAVGWYGHLGNPQKNPLMPDLFIFNAPMMRCLMVELKTHNVFQVGQKEMIEGRAWWMASTYEEFILQLGAWEETNKGE